MYTTTFINTGKHIFRWFSLYHIIKSSIHHKYTLQKKVMQHDFDWLYFFYPGFVFIKLDIPGKPVYLPFDWCLICSDCFTEACVRVGWVNWGQCQKGRVAKFIGFYGKCVLGHVSCRSFCERMHACPLRPGPFIVPKSSETEHHAEFQIVMQFWNIYFLTLRLI